MTNHKLLTGVDVNSKNIKKLTEHLNTHSVVVLAEQISLKSDKEQIIIFNAIPNDKAVLIFNYLSFKTQENLLTKLPSQSLVHLLNALSPDDRTKIFTEVSDSLKNQLLKYLSPEERSISVKLLGYPENSVGRLMTPDYIAIKMEWTVKQVLDYIREKGRDSETINVIYAVDDNGILVDDFRIREFFFASLKATVKDLADYNFIALRVDDDEEKAVNIFRKYERVALPVVDSRGILLGIVTADDIVDLAVKENTEDMQKVAGVIALQEPYMQIAFPVLIRKRVGWLIVLFLGELLTASAMGFFADEIAKAVVLALFLPLIISSGGNAGSQASTLIVRSMALGEITLKDWWRIMRREICAGVILGSVLGSIGFFRIALWSQFSNMYGAHWILVALTIFLALIGVVLWGTLSGSMLPLILKRCGADPAISSAPFVATIVDVAGVIIYFTVALVVLRGSLL